MQAIGIMGHITRANQKEKCHEQAFEQAIQISTVQYNRLDWSDCCTTLLSCRIHSAEQSDMYKYRSHSPLCSEYSKQWMEELICKPKKIKGENFDKNALGQHVLAQHKEQCTSWKYYSSIDIQVYSNDTGSEWTQCSVVIGHWHSFFSWTWTTDFSCFFALCAHRQMRPAASWVRLMKEHLSRRYSHVFLGHPFTTIWMSSLDLIVLQDWLQMTRDWKIQHWIRKISTALEFNLLESIRSKCFLGHSRLKSGKLVPVFN